VTTEASTPEHKDSTHGVVWGWNEAGNPGVPKQKEQVSEQGGSPSPKDHVLRKDATQHTAVASVARI